MKRDFALLALEQQRFFAQRTAAGARGGGMSPPSNQTSQIVRQIRAEFHKGLHVDGNPSCPLIVGKYKPDTGG